MDYYSPLRYPGGKGRLSPLLKDIIVENDICDGTYIEPYAGGAAVGLSLLMEEYVWNIIINDIDPAVYSFWYSILTHTEWFLKKLHDTPVTMDEWNTQKSIFEYPQNYSIKSLGFSTFFLNRTNRSGILNAGIIGGKKQTGNYRITARFNKENLADRIQKIASHKNRIQLYNLDAGDLIKKVEKKIKGKAFFYFDPPYYNKGGLLYTNHYKHDDHQKMAGVIKKLSSPWIVTYDDVPAINEIYSGVLTTKFSMTYSANSERPKATEVMFYNKIKLPKYMQEMKNPYFSRGKTIDLNVSLVLS